MRFGAHISIAGKIYQVAERAKRIGCNTAQIFSRNPRGWQLKELLSDEVKRLKDDLERFDIHPLIVHIPYLPNLASPKIGLYLKSVNALEEDLKRSEVLGAPYLVTHIGSFGESSREEGLERVSEGINTAFNRIKNEVILLLENTAGAGRELGSRFEEIAKIIENIKEKERIGICLDTCHGFVSGYDFRTKKAVSETLKLFDNLIGLKKLKVVHANDSKSPMGSRIDRHWHIGKGYIGEEGFRALLHHPAMRNLPIIIETPFKESGDDVSNLAILRKLAK
ncbi:deoxyribonuclease IV [bacterium]|nr:deoxyribonuclease IV [bacterium]MBU4310744.1 deoxyribonuclease IV [bacterium]MBU4561576.1 deoxyribonuclease IV [bacterium]MCG2676122.1 deoxyribonuclease IV [bacterium]MCG2678132.1 deoxyribonuclease IV [bacterium]